MNHGLSSRDAAILREALARRRIAGALVFGSRATGAWRTGSDLDLALLGDVSEATMDRLATELGESTLSMDVDVVAYDRVANPRLRAHIDAVGTPLTVDG